jgi:NhaA family Na+:H+ antiporter
VGLKVFLMALAIYDDLGAIAIIGVFYSHGLEMGVLLIALVALGVLGTLNVAGVQRLAPYLVTGFVLWFAVLKSGVHATLAGVALGLFIPLGPDGMRLAEDGPIRRALDTLHPWVAFGILPVFAFMNAGVPVGAVTAQAVFSPIPVGVAAGLFFGKQFGVFGASWLALRAGGAALPEGVTLGQLYGVALLCGVGFTMSLFIGTLALSGEYQQLAQLGLLAGSAAAGLAGYAWLRFALR